MNKKIILGATTIIVLIAGVFTYHYLSEKQLICWPYCPGMTDKDREDIKKSALETDTDSWKTYTFNGDSPYLSSVFDFKYPPDWKLDFGTYTTPGDSKNITSISLTSPDGIDQIVYGSGGPQAELTCDKLSNMKERPGRIICTMVKDIPFFLTYIDNQEAVLIYNKILSTFKFIK